MYDNAQQNIILTSDSSSDDEPFDEQGNVQTQPQGNNATAHFPQQPSDSEEESQDLAGRRK